jgi:hypothetical protein
MISEMDRLICVLGMHRSGTSCMTGSLQQAGLFLGNCHTWNPHNKKGNRENQDFVDLNDSILAANGAAWDKPPSKKVAWSSEHRSRAEHLLVENLGDAPLGFKDPRTLLVLQGWKTIFPAIQFVGIVRHPNAVAQSLQRRSDMPREQALLLWYSYNRLLLNEYRRKSFPVLCFDEDEKIFHEKLDQLVGYLGLEKNTEDNRFYEDQLKTSGSQLSAARLPWKIKWLYGRLLKICV